MRIIVSDASCLIDLRKASLLEALTRIPYDIQIPDLLYHGELLKFSIAQKEILLRNCMIVELSADGILRAQTLQEIEPRLSMADCFTCVLAEQNPGSILLTGDAALRSTATRLGIETHGVLWLIDQFFSHKLVEKDRLRAVLEDWVNDPSIHLPSREVQRRLNRLR